MMALRFLAIFSLATIVSVKASAQFIKAEVMVSGMTCSMCQMATHKALKTIDYVSDIKSDLRSNSYMLSFRKDKPIDLELIKKKVKDAGFSVSRLVATFNFNQKTSISNNSVFNYDGTTYRFTNVQNRILSGDVNLMLVGNGFVTNSDFKKYAAQNNDPSYKTGTLGKVKVLHITLAAN